MKTQNQTGASKGSKNVSKNSVSNTKTTRRVVETRDMYDVIFNHAVSLVAEYVRCFAYGEAYPDGEQSRKGFAFGSTSEQPHTRGYAKSLIWGFATNKAGKTLKGLDDRFLDAAGKPEREKIAIAILTDTKLVKGDSKAIAASLNKVEPKRERVFAESVLTELNKQVKLSATTKGGKASKKSETKAAPKGAKAKSETKATAHRGSKAKGAKAGKASK